MISILTFEAVDEVQVTVDLISLRSKSAEL